MEYYVKKGIREYYVTSVRKIIIKLDFIFVGNVIVAI